MLGSAQAGETAAYLFGRAELGHASRVSRLVGLTAGLLQNPAASIPSLFDDPHQLKAAYRFLSNPEVAFSDLLDSLADSTLRRSSDSSLILLLADTTEFDFSSQEAIEDLGHIGDGGGTGFLAHTVLAFDFAKDSLLGVVEQRTWIRETFKNSRKETTAQRKKRKRESERWGEDIKKAAFRFQDHFTSKSMPHLIAVSDQESDNFEYFNACQEALVSFVSRIYQNRCIVEESGHIKEAVLASRAAGEKEIEVGRRPGKKARKAVVEIRFAPVTLLPPHGRRKEYKPLPVNLVIAEEKKPPSGEEGIFWLIATTERVESKEDALRIFEIYEKRWLIEEFHMGLKTGCQFERRQLKSRAALERFLAIADGIACELLRLREMARKDETILAETVLRKSQLIVLKLKKPKLSEKPTIREALRAIATLGGFIGRKSDGEPGWRTLFTGLHELLLLEQGFLLAHTSGEG